MIKNAPIPADENNLVAGAQIYHEQCAACHGNHGKPSSFGSTCFPRRLRYGKNTATESWA